MSRPKRIFIVRHGESEGNKDPKIYATVPDYGVWLTDLGHEQACKAGREIAAAIGTPMEYERVQIYCSPYHRTRQTAEDLVSVWPEETQKNLLYREEPDLIEQSGGTTLAAREKAVDEERNAYGTFYYQFERGESAMNVYDRASIFFDTMFRDFDSWEGRRVRTHIAWLKWYRTASTSVPEPVVYQEPSTVVLVSHGMTSRVLLMRFFRWTVEEFELVRNPRNGEVILLELNDAGKYELKSELRKRPAVAHPFQYTSKLLRERE